MIQLMTSLEIIVYEVIQLVKGNQDEFEVLHLKGFQVSFGVP